MIQHPTQGAIPFNLYGYQKDMIRAYQANRYVIVLSARQTGKEQPHTSKIAIPGGWTTMGNIQPGNIVLTPDGDRVPVISKHPQGIKDVYVVTLDDGSMAECGLDHLWTVHIPNHNDTQKQTFTLNEIIKYKKLHPNDIIYIPDNPKANFDTQQLSVDPYLLGAIIAGQNTTQNEDIIVTITEEVIKKTIQLKLLTYGYTLDPISGEDNRYTIVDSGDASTYNEYCDIIKINSDDVHIPEEFLVADYTQRILLLQGILDIHGVPISTNGTSFITPYQHLGKNIQQLVWSLGGKCSMTSHSSPQGEIYSLIIIIPSHINCFLLSSKRDRFDDIPEVNLPTRRAIVDITYNRKEESSCITVDHKDQLYITDDYIVTHNSVTSAAYLLWYTMFNFDKTVLIASNKNSNAMEVILRIRYAYENLPNWIKPGVTEDGWNKHLVGFDTDSRVVSTATSDNAGRGMSISLLYLDEFAFVAANVQKQFWKAIAPTLSTGGSCIMTSTPNGDMNDFAQLWRGANIPHAHKPNVGINGFHPIQVRWNDPPGRDDMFKEEQIDKLGDRVWMQEYECCAGETTVDIQDQNGNNHTISMINLHELLTENMVLQQ